MGNLSRLVFLPMVLGALLTCAKPAVAQIVVLPYGSAKIYNYLGLRSGSTPGGGYETAWAEFMIPDFSGSIDYPRNLVISNTESIRTSVYTRTTTTLLFQTSGLVYVGTDYGGLGYTDMTTDGHVYTAAQFDWTTNFNYPEAKYLRLELRTGPPGFGGLIWSAQPGEGTHSGHVEVTFPYTWDVSFRLATAYAIVPEPSSMAALASGLAGMIFVRRRRRRT